MSKQIPHRWVKLTIKCFPWQVCRGCGLIMLNNNRTALAIKAGCDCEED